ncbi:hypothetical protein [Chitinophaga ginsengisoli]|uniref:AhpC/TSA family protein n=1 Tax=Chitinophaga ginsengisoli TaxID=363837 RepID=A0A2P8FS15_9BACT|nr:hypothetical protein [Chitinophaga ginsengisoli]PSL24445.1 hypothetical protein CLV42_11532 [Chitinophaga ginsengisoli]
MKRISKRTVIGSFIVILLMAGSVTFLISRSHPEKPLEAVMKEDLINTEKTFDEKMKLDEGKRLSLDSLPSVNINDQEHFSFPADHYLVVRFSEVNCETCVESIFSVLEASKAIDSSHVIVLVDFRSEAYLRTFVRLNTIRFPIFKHPAINSFLHADALGYPYLFVADRDGLLHHFFCPAKEDPQRTIAYLNSIKLLFNDQK